MLWGPLIPNVENRRKDNRPRDFIAVVNMVVDVMRSDLLAKQQYSGIDRILSPARDKLRQLNKDVSIRHAREILNIFEDELRNYQTENLFPLYAFQSENGSVLLEWASPNCRAGINIEADNVESGWYLIVNKVGQEHQEWGYIETLDVKEIVSYMTKNAC